MIMVVTVGAFYGLSVVP